MPVRILVCDDSQLARQMIVRMLRAEPGVEVAGEAADGYDCLAKILELKPDLVLLDLEMPKVDGVQCIAEARELGITTPFLVMSEPSGEARAQAALAAGAEGFLVKPASLLQMERIQPELSRRVKQFIAHHPATAGSRPGENPQMRS